MKGNRRMEFLDSWRGSVIISMILYHACWDLVWIFGISWQWFTGISAWIWQQSICLSFIFLSGFCWNMGRHPLRRGAVVLGAGGMVTVSTVLFFPEGPIFFGILTLLGTAMTGTVFLHGCFQKVNPSAGILSSLLMFFLFQKWRWGIIGAFQIQESSASVFSPVFRAWIGYPAQGFYSADYFPLLPWIFIFWSGYFTYREMEAWKNFPVFMYRGHSFFSWTGKQSLLIYLLHQPVLLLGMHIYFNGLDFME